MARLAAEDWGTALEVSQQRGLVVTLNGVGDAEDGTHYGASTIKSEPMVTWLPAGTAVDRFCLVFFWRSESSASVRLTWLVSEIPGLLSDDDPSVGLCSYGLAGNHAAVARGTPLVAYEAPAEEGALMVLLFKQRKEIASTPFVPEVSRCVTSIAEFASTHGLGEVCASRVVLISSAHVPEASECSKPMAYCSGGDLKVDPSSPSTLTEALQRTAQAFPDRGLTIYDKGGKQSQLRFSTLRELSISMSCGLRARGFQRNSSALLQVPTLEYHFVAFWSCLMCSIRPVAIAIPPNYENAAHAVCGKLCNVWRLLEGPPVISTVSYLERVALLRKSAGMASMDLVAVEDLMDIGKDGARLCAGGGIFQIEPMDVAFYQLSSGSTGVPKCIQITHGGVVAHIRGETQFCKISSSDVHLNFLPVDHVVPILTVHCCDVYHGCEEVQADVAWVISEPLRWLRLLASHRATRTWSPNFAFKLVADALRHQACTDVFDLSHCRYWMNAGEQVTIPVCEDFLEQTSCFGVVRGALQPAFGMAEACTCMTYNNEFAIRSAGRLGRSTFVNLGPPVPGVEIRIADHDNQTLCEEVIGRFQIRGPVITPGYVNNEEANQASFVGDDWFNTGDLGFIRDGCLFLTGREKEMIIVRGANFYCYEIEDIINALPSVAPTFTAVVSVHDPNTGTEGFAVFYVPRGTDGTKQADPEPAEIASEIRKILGRHIGLAPMHVVPLLREEFPKTTSGKIQRRELALALKSGRFDAHLGLESQN